MLTFQASCESMYLPNFLFLTLKDHVKHLQSGLVCISGGISQTRYINTSITRSPAPAQTLVMCNTQNSMYCNAALHSELYLTPWQTHTTIQGARSTHIPWIFLEKIDIGPKPVPWLLEYVKHGLFSPLFFTYSWLEHQLVASSQDCKAFAFTCRVTALLNCSGIYSAL